jgi:MCP family monocarboxylic acid transporter-like MFS transporter 10
MTLSSLTSIICITATGYKMLIIYAVVIGILDGSFIGLMSIVTFECSNRQNMSRAWGGVLMCMSLSMLVGAPAGSK